MFSVAASPLPAEALLMRYAESGAYTDCYHTVFDGAVSHAQFVNAFYTTWLFKLERSILKWAVSRPSTDSDARALAQGSVSSFSAWDVERKVDNQLLLTDFRGRTRSWLMTRQLESEGVVKTSLYFGSAVTPVSYSSADQPSMGAGFSLLLGFHKLYSILLLSCAKSRLRSTAELPR